VTWSPSSCTGNLHLPRPKHCATSSSFSCFPAATGGSRWSKEIPPIYALWSAELDCGPLAAGPGCSLRSSKTTFSSGSDCRAQKPYGRARWLSRLFLTVISSALPQGYGASAIRRRSSHRLQETACRSPCTAQPLRPKCTWQARARSYSAAGCAMNFAEACPWRPCSREPWLPPRDEAWRPQPFRSSPVLCDGLPHRPVSPSRRVLPIPSRWPFGLGDPGIAPGEARRYPRTIPWKAPAQWIWNSRELDTSPSSHETASKVGAGRQGRISATRCGEGGIRTR